MKSSQFIEAVALKTGLPKNKAKLVVQEVLHSIQETVAGGEVVEFLGFGKFEAVDRKARVARNPINGEPIAVPAKKVPVFKAGKAFKAAVL